MENPVPIQPALTSDKKIMPSDRKAKLVPYAGFAGLHPSVPLERWPVDQRVIGLDSRTLLPVKNPTGQIEVPGLVLALASGKKYQVVGGIAAWTLATKLACEWGSARIMVRTLVLGVEHAEFGEPWLQRELMMAGVTADTTVLKALLAQGNPLVLEMSHKTIARIFGITAGTSSVLRRQAKLQRPKKPSAIKAKVAATPAVASATQAKAAAKHKSEHARASTPPSRKAIAPCPTSPQYSLL